MVVDRGIRGPTEVAHASRTPLSLEAGCSQQVHATSALLA